MLIYLMALDTEEERVKFVRIYEEYRNRMHYTANILLKSEMEAEDMVHDTLLTLTDYLDRIDEKDSIGTWNYIVTILKNKCYNFMKRNKRMELTEDEDVFEQSVEMYNLLENQLIKEEAEEFLNTLIKGLKYPYREVIYQKPKSHEKFEKVCKRIEYTPEIEAIFQIYCSQMDNPDWEFWNEELKETRAWKEDDFHTYKREIFKKDVTQSVYFLPVLWVLKFVDNYYIPIVFIGITVFIYCSSYADKWAGKIKDLTKEYQRAALRQLIDEKQEVYRMTESIEG